MRICVFSERQVSAADEGIRNYALALARALESLPRAPQDVRMFTMFGETQPGGGRAPRAGVTNLPGNPLLLSLPLRRALRAFAPELVLYVPTACATPFSFLRARVLKRYARGAPVVLVALQPRRYGRVARAIMRRLCPDLLLVQSEATRATLAPLACAMRLIRPGVDLERFRPLPDEQRTVLRMREGLSPDAYVLLHVGHLNRARGLQALLALQGVAGQQLMVVGSSTTPQDEGLVAELRSAGVRVIDRFVADIAEFYQLADGYVFAVQSERASIDVPLSVLEALACDLPVVTTRLEGLTRLFAPAPGLIYVDSPQELPAAVAACRSLPTPVGTRALVAEYAWPRVVEHLLAVIAEELPAWRAWEAAP